MKSLSRIVITTALIFVLARCVDGVTIPPENRTPPPTAQTADLITPPECNGIIWGGLVLLIGAVVYVGLMKLCKNISPPQNPPPPPPPKPKGTNTPPPGLVQPLQLNPLDDPGIQLSLEIDTNAFSLITPYNYVDPDGFPYQAFCAQRLESSTNLSEWQTVVTVTQWISDANIMIVCGDSNNIAISTNLIPTVTGQFTNSMALDLIQFDAPAKFYRLISQ